MWRGFRIRTKPPIDRATARQAQACGLSRPALAGSVRADVRCDATAKAASSGQAYARPECSCRLHKPQQDLAGGAFRHRAWTACQMKIRDAVARALPARMAAKGDGFAP